MLLLLLSNSLSSINGANPFSNGNLGAVGINSIEVEVTVPLTFFARLLPVLLLLLLPLFLLPLLVTLLALTNESDTVRSGMSGRSEATASDVTVLEAAASSELGLLLLRLSSLASEVPLNLDSGELGTVVRDSRAPDVTVEGATGDLTFLPVLVLVLLTFFLFLVSFSIL